MTIGNEVIVVALQAWRATPFGGDALMAALEAAAPIIRADAGAKALDDAAAQILTNDPLDYWANHLPEGLGFQEAMSHWLKAHAAAVRGEG